MILIFLGIFLVLLEVDLPNFLRKHHSQLIDTPVKNEYEIYHTGRRGGCIMPVGFLSRRVPIGLTIAVHLQLAITLLTFFGCLGSYWLQKRPIFIVFDYEGAPPPPFVVPWESEFFWSIFLLWWMPQVLKWILHLKRTEKE